MCSSDLGFEKAYALQTDMNLPASEILSTYVYRIGLLKGDYGYSTAVGLFNSVVNVILLIFVNWVVLFTFPSQYYALSVTKKYLALRGGPRSFRQGFSCLVLLWILLDDLGFRIRGFHSLRPDFPVRSPILRLSCRSPNPVMHAPRFGLLPFRSPLLWKSINFLSLPPGT